MSEASRVHPAPTKKTVETFVSAVFFFNFKGGFEPDSPSFAGIVYAHIKIGRMSDILPIIQVQLLLFTKRQKLFLKVGRRVVGGVAV